MAGLLSNALRTLMPFDRCEQILYASNASAQSLFNSDLETRYQSGYGTYLATSYELNPFYRTFRAGLQSGAYRLRDLAAMYPAACVDFARYRVHPRRDEEIGFLTDGMPTGDEEACIGVRVGREIFIGVSLSRKRSLNGFSAFEMKMLSKVVPFIDACYRRHWRSISSASLFILGSHSAGAHWTEGPGNLSPREHTILELLLKGHTAHSISLRLTIALTTVKTHQKNIYRKLGIATRFELFSLFTDALKAHATRYEIAR